MTSVIACGWSCRPPLRTSYSQIRRRKSRTFFYFWTILDFSFLNFSQHSHKETYWVDSQRITNEIQIIQLIIFQFTKILFPKNAVWAYNNCSGCPFSIVKYFQNMASASKYFFPSWTFQRTTPFKNTIILSRVFFLNFPSVFEECLKNVTQNFIILHDSDGSRGIQLSVCELLFFTYKTDINFDYV